MKPIQCLRCSEPFERKPRGPMAHHCPMCRVVIKRERTRARMAARRAEVDVALSRLPHEVSLSAREWAYEAATRAGEKLPVQNDRMPEGSKTPSGSDDGRSTYFTDLAEDLDILSADATRHTCRDTEPPYAHHTSKDCGGCFWDDRPHWCVGL